MHGWTTVLCMPTLTAPRRGGLVRVRVEAFNRLLARAIHNNPRQHVSNGQLASFLGLAPSTASRLRSGEQGAGLSTLAKFQRQFPDIPLESAFHITPNHEFYAILCGPRGSQPND